MPYPTLISHQQWTVSLCFGKKLHRRAAKENLAEDELAAKFAAAEKKKRKKS
jgi:hypothetical protein